MLKELTHLVVRFIEGYDIDEMKSPGQQPQVLRFILLFL